MNLEIKNLKLNKEKYIYWLDDSIELSFELESDENEIIKEIVIFYWYNFYWEEQRHKAFNNSIVKKNKVISQWVKEKFSFTIPIKIFNLSISDWFNNMKITNYINIKIKNKFFINIINKKLYPNIIIKQNAYWLNNFTVQETIWLDNNGAELINNVNNNEEILLIDNIEYLKENTLENEKDSNLEYLSKRVEISEKIKQNEWDFVIIKKQFKWIFSWWITKIMEEDSLFADYIHKNIYKKLKENIIINIFHYLVNSKIYNFIHKYIFILPIIFIANEMFNNIIFKIISSNLDNNLIFIYVFLVFPIWFLLFSKLFEKLFEKVLNSKIYNFKLLDTKIIESNLNNKLTNWILNISDIIENFNIKVWNNNIDYNFRISLRLNVWTFNGAWKSKTYHAHNVYLLQLFNNTWKWYFDLNKVSLLANNYSNLKLLLPNSVKSPWTKIYYTLDYSFSSSHLPDIEWSKKFYLKF